MAGYVVNILFHIINYKQIMIDVHKYGKYYYQNRQYTLFVIKQLGTIAKQSQTAKNAPTFILKGKYARWTIESGPASLYRSRLPTTPTNARKFWPFSRKLPNFKPLKVQNWLLAYMCY